MANQARFSKKTIDFLIEAGEATSPDWLTRNAKRQEEVLTTPLRELAQHLLKEVGSLPMARGYRFPKRGFGRIKRPAHKVGRGEPVNRDWVHFNAAKPSISRFDSNPALYFYLSPEKVFSAGGLYDATSRQVRQIREWIANDPKELVSVVKSKAFLKEFPRGMETDKILKTFPRAYPIDHKRIEWLRLQAYYTRRDYTKRELYSADFKDILAENWLQGLRFNEPLYTALKDLPYSFTPKNIAPEQAIEDISDDDVTESPTRGELWDDRL